MASMSTFPLRHGQLFSAASITLAFPTHFSVSRQFILVIETLPRTPYWSMERLLWGDKRLMRLSLPPWQLFLGWSRRMPWLRHALSNQVQAVLDRCFQLATVAQPRKYKRSGYSSCVVYYRRREARTFVSPF